MEPQNTGPDYSHNRLNQPEYGTQPQSQQDWQIYLRRKNTPRGIPIPESVIETADRVQRWIDDSRRVRRT